MYTVRELQSNEHQLWDAFLTKSSQSNIFHRIDWNQMLVDTDPRYDGFLPLVCLNKDDSIIAAIAIPYQLSSSGRFAGPLFLGYRAPILSDELHYGDKQHAFLSHSVLVELTKKLVEYIPTICLNNSPDIWDVRFYMFNGWRIQTVYTHEWKRVDDPWQRIAPSLRTRINHGEKKYSLQLITDEKSYELFERSTASLDMSILRRRLAWMNKTGIGRLYALTDSQGQPVAFTLPILSTLNNRAYLWGTTCLDNRIEIEILPTLFWHVCSVLRSEFAYIDFGYSKNMQVSQIKDNLGARLLPTFIATYPENKKIFRG